MKNEKQTQRELGNLNKDCLNCSNLLSSQPDIVCHIYCSVHRNVDFTFGGDTKETAMNCESFEED